MWVGKKTNLAMSRVSAANQLQRSRQREEMQKIKREWEKCWFSPRWANRVGDPGDGSRRVVWFDGEREEHAESVLEGSEARRFSF